MPQVPIYNRVIGESKSPDVQVNTQAPQGAFGGGQYLNSIEQAAGSFQDAGLKALKTTADYFNEEKKKADNLAVREAYIKAVQLKNKLFWDPQTGAMGKKGRDAFGVVDEYGKQFDSGMKAIEDGLFNSEQKALFQSQVKLPQTEDLNDHLQKHTYAETQKYDDEVTKSALAVTHDETVKNYQSPQRIANGLLSQEQIILESAKRNGIGPEQYRMQIEEMRSKTHAGVIDSMIADQQDKMAQEYFTAHKDEITDPKETNRIKKLLDDSSYRGESQQLAQDIFHKSPENLKNLMNEVNKISDPRLQDETRQRIEHMYSINDKANQDIKEKTFLNAYNTVEGTRNIDAINPNIWSTFNPSQREILQKLVTKDPTTDLTLYNDLMMMGSNPQTRQKFLDMDLTQHMGNLSKSDFLKLVQFKSGLLKNDDQANKLATGFRTKAQEVDGVATDVLRLNPKSDKDELNKFRVSVEDAVTTEQSKLGRELSPSEVRQIAEKQATEVIVKKPGAWFSGSSRVYELGPEDKIKDVDIEGIPPRTVNQIKQALINQGVPVNENNIVKMYKRYLDENK